MKRLAYLLIPFSLICANITFANPKSLNLPFFNQPIAGQNYNGITFIYEMSRKPTKKVICKLTNTYKSWLEYYDGGELQETHTYGDSNGIDTITLTSKGKNINDQYRADSAGSVKIKGLTDKKGSAGLASCYYDIDENNR